MQASCGRLSRDGLRIATADCGQCLMKSDDELCLCFHVTRRKVEQYIRARRPAVASQLSDCYGAGTGCGWCRPFLQRLHAQLLGDDQAANQSDPLSEDLPDATSYAADRAAYRATQKANTEDK
jgi:bacterioferritin-associated ferredoxin